MKGYLYPSTQKLAVGERLPGDSEYKPENSGPNDINTLDQSSGHSGLQGPENPALYPENPGKAGINFQFMVLWSCFVAHKCLYRFS